MADEATPVLASNIAKINAATDVSVDATAVSVVSGTEGDVHSVLMSASVGGVDFTLAGVDAVSARLSDSTSVTASKVKDLDGKTAGGREYYGLATAIGGLRGGHSVCRRVIRRHILGDQPRGDGVGGLCGGLRLDVY